MSMGSPSATVDRSAGPLEPDRDLDTNPVFTFPVLLHNQRHGCPRCDEDAGTARIVAHRYVCLPKSCDSDRHLFAIGEGDVVAAKVDRSTVVGVRLRCFLSLALRPIRLVL